MLYVCSKTAETQRCQAHCCSRDTELLRARRRRMSSWHWRDEARCARMLHVKSELQRNTLHALPLTCALLLQAHLLHSISCAFKRIQTVLHSQPRRHSTPLAPHMLLSPCSSPTVGSTAPWTAQQPPQSLSTRPRDSRTCRRRCCGAWPPACRATPPRCASGTSAATAALRCAAGRGAARASPPTRSVPSHAPQHHRTAVRWCCPDDQCTSPQRHRSPHGSPAASPHGRQPSPRRPLCRHAPRRVRVQAQLCRRFPQLGWQPAARRRRLQPLH
jgi:hypothetical protein